MQTIHISHPTGNLSGRIELDGSKSISNRVLIIRALSPKPFEVDHLSTSDDTTVLRSLLEAGSIDHFNVGHAGTSFRFLTALLAFRQGTQVLTGSQRMKERPIGPLVEALNRMGARIEYAGKNGYPPLNIHSPSEKIQDHVSIDAGISSQYLTALILIGPTLPNGLTLNLIGTMVSESYLNLTLGIIRDFGIDFEKREGRIHLPPQIYKPMRYRVEADWSACSYYYALTSMAKSANLSIGGLMEKSLQGDAALIDAGKYIGVKSHFEQNELKLTRSPDWSPSNFSYNFINQPDIAQTMAVACAAAGVAGQFYGLKTLRIKETDRISALHNELGKIGSSFKLVGTMDGDEIYQPGPLSHEKKPIPVFDTYKDHRMAMSFAPLGLKFPIMMNNPGVVSKSYPYFWEDLKSLGFNIYSVSE